MKKNCTILFCLISLSYFAKAQSFNHENYCAHTKSTTVARRASAAAPANSLMQQYDVKFYFLDLVVQRDTNQVGGHVKSLSKVVSAALDTFVFELHPNFIIDSVVINGANLPFFRRGSDVYTPLASTALLGDMIDATVFYNGTSPTGASAAIGNGYTAGTSTRWGNKVCWSLSQPFAAYEWFPCKQDLMDKIDSTYFYITTDTPNLAGSNGILKQVVNLPSGQRQFQWINIHAIDYYLISVACAKYIDYSVYAHPVGSADSVLMQNYIYDNPGTLPAFKGLIDTTALTLDFFATIFGPYPFDEQKYGHCMAPFSGGMEHQTMTSQGFFDFSIDAHELGHQWFGDNVTCQTWRDIWVNEGFASYSEQLAIEHFYPAYKDLNMNFVHESVMSQPDGALWFSDSTNVPRIFDGRLTYDKGGAIIHTLRFLCNNDSLFFNGLKTYQNTFKNATATAEDLKSIMQTTSGVNLTDWMNNWFYGEGYPTYNVRWNQVGKNVYVNVSHTTSASSTTLFKTPIEIKFNSPTGDTIIRFNISSNNEDFLVELENKTIDSLIVDPNNWVINKASTAKDGTLAIMESQQENSFSIFPTLVKDNVQVKSNMSGELMLKLVDMSGKQLETRQFNTSAMIDMQRYAAGTYTVMITDENGRTIKTEKVIKQ